jgi:plasmid maintenance system antidote protein VapI
MGRRGPLVDAEPARRHVQALMAAGVGYARIAAAAGVATSTINHMLYPRHSRQPAAKLNHENARRILSVRAEDVVTGLVNAAGSARRIRALMAVGWPPMHLATRIGVHPHYVSEIHRSNQVFATTAHAVAATYNQLWDKNPQHYGVSQQAANRFRNYARANGWAPPAAWDDDQLDDPAGAPHVGDDDSTVNRDELAEYRRQEIAHLASFGIPEHEIAQRLGMSASYIHDLIRDRLSTAA